MLVRWSRSGGSVVACPNGLLASTQPLPNQAQHPIVPRPISFESPRLDGICPGQTRLPRRVRAQFRSVGSIITTANASRHCAAAREAATWPKSLPLSMAHHAHCSQTCFRPRQVCIPLRWQRRHRHRRPPWRLDCARPRIREIHQCVLSTIGCTQTHCIYQRER